MLPYFKFSALHYTHFLTNECHISESGSRCVIGKCCLVHFQPFNGEAQTLIISLYLVLESHLTFQKFQNSSPRLQYPTICPYDEKILSPWISTLMLCRFVDPGISLAFLVKGYMRSLYTFCSTGRIVRENSFYTLQHLQLIFFCSMLKHLYRETMQDDRAETPEFYSVNGDWNISWFFSVPPHIFQEGTSN